MSEIVNIKDLHAKGLNNMAISRLVNKGIVGNLGYGFYVYNPNPFHLDCDETLIKINNLLNEFPIKPNRMVFSSISLNYCINQLISSTTYVVEVEKEYLEAVFLLLKTRLNNLVLLKPNDKEKNNYWEPNAIYVFELFSRSPTNEDGSIKVEKLIVDLLFDEKLSSLYSGLDIELIVDNLCTKSLINYKTLFSYAKRKNRINELFEKIGKYLPEEIKEFINNVFKKELRKELY